MSQSFLITIWAFAIGLSVFRFFEEKIGGASVVHSRKIISFIVGSMVPIIFLELLMHVYHAAIELSQFIALFLPFGFVLSYLIERHIYREHLIKNKKKELHEMYAIVTFIWSFFLGIVFATEIQENLYTEILLLTTFCLFHIMGSIYISHIDEEETEVHSSVVKRFVFSLAPVYGYLLASNLHISHEVTAALLAIFTGAMIHTIVDNLFTEEKATLLSWFLFGNILFTFLFAINIVLL